MGRALVDLHVRAELGEPAEIHHRDPVGHVPDHGQVVRDEDVGQAELVLQLLQQVDDLRLHRDVECGHRFVADDDLRPKRQPAGDPDALALTTGELVRVPVDVLLRPTTSSNSCTSTLAVALGRDLRVMSNGSPTMSPTVMRGLSEEYGSWKMIWMLRLRRRSAFPLAS